MNRSVCQYDDVAAAIGAGNYDKVLLLGDIQYEAGLYQDFVDNFDVYFGDLLPTTAPAPGNHEYGDPGAAGYFRYFGALAPASFYSFDLGAWHVVSLDSTICGAGGLECLAGVASAFVARPTTSRRATHCARSRSGTTLDGTGSSTRTPTGRRTIELLRSKPLWDLLYAHDADLVLTGHNHNYSRWKPADRQGRFDPDRGLTQFVVGTGGRNLNDFGNFHTRPEIFARGQSKAFGFLDLRLRPGDGTTGGSQRTASRPSRTRGAVRAIDCRYGGLRCR